MKVLLLSLALVAAAFADAEVDPAVEEIRAILVNANVSTEAITEFFAANLNVMPFTPETFAAYNAWKLKWNADVRELEIRSNDVLMTNVQKEVLHRMAEFIAHLGERIPVLEDLARKETEEGVAKEREIDGKSSTFEIRLMQKISRHMMKAVEKEWGLITVEGELEQAPESDDDQQQDEEKDGEKEETVEGDKEGESEVKKEEEGDEQKEEEAATEKPE